MRTEGIEPPTDRSGVCCSTIEPYPLAILPPGYPSKITKKYFNPEIPFNIMFKTVSLLASPLKLEQTEFLTV